MLSPCFRVFLLLLLLSSRNAVRFYDRFSWPSYYVGLYGLYRQRRHNLWVGKEAGELDHFVKKLELVLAFLPDAVT